MDIIILKIRKYISISILASPIIIKNEETNAHCFSSSNQKSIGVQCVIVNSIACSVAIIHFVSIFVFHSDFAFEIENINGIKAHNTTLNTFNVAHSFYRIDHLFSNIRINNAFSNFVSHFFVVRFFHFHILQFFKFIVI